MQHNRAWEDTATYISYQIKEVQEKINILIAQHKTIAQDIDNLQTIPGIGHTTAIAIVAQMPAVSAFVNAREFAAFAGLTPSHKTSGSSVRGRARTSKMGSWGIRKALYFPAIAAKNYNPILKAFSDKLKKKGKHIMLIIVAVMRKLLHIIYAILKNKTVFSYQAA